MRTDWEHLWCWLAVFLGATSVGILVGCGTKFTRADLVPVATLAPRREPYAQVRTVGFAPFNDLAGSVQLAAIVDIRNTSPLPVTVDLAQATATFESVETLKATSRSVVASGLGDLPTRVKLNRPPMGSLTLLPTQSLTFWMIFEPNIVGDEARYSLTLPVRLGDPLVLTLYQPGKPYWKVSGTEKMALTVRMMSETLGRNAEIFSGGFALWYGRGPLSFGGALGSGSLYARYRGQDFRQSPFSSVEASVSWRPPSWVTGAYASARVMGLVHMTSEGTSSRWFPSLSVGVQAALSRSPLPVAFVRLGYTHVFESDPYYTGGLSLSLDLRCWVW